MAEVAPWLREASGTVALAGTCSFPLLLPRWELGRLNDPQQGKLLPAWGGGLLGTNLIRAPGSSLRHFVELEEVG